VKTLFHKKFLFISTVFCVLLFVPLVASVDASSAWWRTYGGRNDDWNCSVVSTSDGGYGLAGTTSSFGTGGIDFRLLKTDAEGNERWSQTYGGPASDYACSLIATSDGGYAIVGYTWSFGAGSSDYWLVKIDSNGVQQWAKTYGGSEVDTGESVIATPDGGYALIGRTYSFGDGIPWLVKTDASGNMQWNKTFEGMAGDDRARSVIATLDGGYALTGGSWFIKTDGSGNILWNRTFYNKETSVNQTFTIDYYATYSIVATTDGGYALAGYRVNITGEIIDLSLGSFSEGGTLEKRIFKEADFEQTHSLVEAPDEVHPAANETIPPVEEFLLIKTDAFGNMVWNKTYEGAVSHFPCRLVSTSNEGYAMAGTTRSGNDDFWLAKIDSSGNIQWNQTYGGTKGEEMHSLITTSDGGYALAGSTNSFGVDWTDFWLIKTDANGTVSAYVLPTSSTVSTPTPTISSSVSVSPSSTTSQSANPTPSPTIPELPTTIAAFTLLLATCSFMASVFLKRKVNRRSA
jgi:hypothetical protein